MNPAKKTSEELWELLLADVDDAKEEITVSDVNMASGAAFARGSSSESFLLRIFGKITDSHRVPVRLATRIMLSFQEALSAVGAANAGRKTAKGPLPASILEATGLGLSPRVGSGSVEFTMVPEPRPDEQETLLDDVDTTLLNDSMNSLLSLLADIGREDIDQSDLARQVQEFGPRAAKHLFDLADASLEGEVGLAMTWRNRRGASKNARLSAQTAAYLKELAQKNTKITEPITLVGVLVTISVEDRPSVRLDNGDKVHLEVDDDQRPGLKELYDLRVRVIADETLSVALGSGTETRTYKLVSIEAA